MTMIQNRRRNNIADMKVTEQILGIKEQICDEYCHFRKTYVHQSDLEEKCETCPLIRL